MFRRGAASYAQATENGATGRQAKSTRPRTVRLRTGDVKDLHPNQIIDSLKQQHMEVKCLQRDNRDHLLTLAHLHQKTFLLEKGYLMVGEKKVLVEDPDRKITFVNIFGAPYELSDDVIVDHLRTFGSIIGKHLGHFVTHPEVENGIRHWRMLLDCPIPDGSN